MGFKLKVRVALAVGMLILLPTLAIARHSGPSKAEAVNQKTDNTSADENGGSQNFAKAEVTINGQPVALPVNGELHKVIKNNNGSTTMIDVSVHNQSSSNAGSSSVSVVSSSLSSAVINGSSPN